MSLNVNGCWTLTWFYLGLIFFKPAILTGLCRHFVSIVHLRSLVCAKASNNHCICRFIICEQDHKFRHSFNPIPPRKRLFDSGVCGNQEGRGCAWGLSVSWRLCLHQYPWWSYTERPWGGTSSVPLWKMPNPGCNCCMLFLIYFIAFILYSFYYLNVKDIFVFSIYERFYLLHR